MAVVQAAFLYHLILVVGLSLHMVTADLYCVQQEEAEDCPGECQGNCSVFMYYVNNTEEYFTASNTVFSFLPGEHMLDTLLAVQHISDLELIHPAENTSNTNQATVKCSGSAGLSFFNVTNLTISGLRFVGCATNSSKFQHLIAIDMSLIYNLRMSGVSILNTIGYGLILDGVFGSSTIVGTIINSSCNIPYGFGGNFAIFCSDLDNFDYSLEHSLTVSESQFLNGVNIKSYNSYASGITVHIKCHIKMHITFDKITVSNNTARVGGNVGIFYTSTSEKWTVVISILNSHIICGNSSIGGGLFMNVAVLNIKGGLQYNITTYPILNINNTEFNQNLSPKVGSAMYIRLHEHYVSTIGTVMFDNCTFNENKVENFKKHTRGGVAVHILTDLHPEYKEHFAPVFRVNFTRCNFLFSQTESQLSSGKTDSDMQTHNGALFVENTKSIYFSSCKFINNSCTAIIAIKSNLLINDWNLIQNNTGTRGGGMVFCAGSLMHLYTGSKLTIENNTALEYGGGIYVEDDLCSEIIPLCFYQVDNITANSSVLRKTMVILTNNKATYAGSALYGGLVDTCTLIDNSIKYPNKSNTARTIFDATFHYGNGSSEISSNPTVVCFCQNHSHQNCLRHITVNSTVPGATFSVSVVLTGQRHGIVPGVVDTKCLGNCTLAQGQKTQLVYSDNCTDLNYTLYADDNTTQTLSLIPEASFFEFASYENALPSLITIHVDSCPLGFIAESQTCKCLFKSDEAKCNISSKTITKQHTSWIGYIHMPPNNTRDIIYHTYCPLDYCNASNVSIKATYSEFYQDAQCASHRRGILCGGCKLNYSLGLGSSACLVCKDKLNILRTAGLVLVCAVAGILLVLFLSLFNLTVSEGTLNGLIFYANIVQVNSDIFFHSESHVRPLIIFIAWLNLDFGFSVCFFDGMDEYARTWLQFIFPLYIWLISGAIVYFSWRTTIVARLAGRNAVKVLATLFLLSFGKLLRNIIAITSFTYVTSLVREHRLVWLTDANVDYLKHKHIVLFVFAILTAALTILYTLSLLFIQCLRRSSVHFIESWMNYLKPLLDAYTGPYRDKYHFWTGLLLLVRVILFGCFASNTTSMPAINLSLIIAVCSTLVLALQLKVYINKFLRLLESCIYLNLILFSTTAMALSERKQVETDYIRIITAYVFVGSVLLLFLGILAYHFYMQVFGTQAIGHMAVWCQERRWCMQQITPIDPLPVPPRQESEGSEESDAENEMDSLAETNSVDVTQLREPLIGGSIQ